jgi:hypothetical protein
MIVRYTIIVSNRPAPDLIVVGHTQVYFGMLFTSFCWHAEDLWFRRYIFRTNTDSKKVRNFALRAVAVIMKAESQIVRCASFVRKLYNISYINQTTFGLVALVEKCAKLDIGIAYGLIFSCFSAIYIYASKIENYLWFG